MKIRKEAQAAHVSDAVSAIFSLIRPILKGLLYSLKHNVVSEVGDYSDIKLFMLPRLYREGDGDTGICFEYAVHDAINRNDQLILDRVQSALSLCRINGDNPSSLLFGAEKTGALSLLSTIKSQLTDDSRLLAGTRGQPVKLRRHIDSVAASFRKRDLREQLPNTICDTWKADLFIGQPSPDQWVATTIKINPRDLVTGRGLRVGIVPLHSGFSDAVYKDEQKNLIVCPLPYDASFMEMFYRAWFITKAFVKADANMPKEVALPAQSDRFVCEELVKRREFTVVDVIEALEIFAQPHLLAKERESIDSYEMDVASVEDLRSEEFGVNSTISPEPLTEVKN